MGHLESIAEYADKLKHLKETLELADELHGSIKSVKPNINDHKLAYEQAQMIERYNGLYDQAEVIANELHNLFPYALVQMRRAFGRKANISLENLAV